MKTALSLTRPPAAEPARPNASPTPAPANGAGGADPRFRLDSRFDARSGAGLRLPKLPDLKGFWDRHVERPFAMGRDGFVAVDARGQVVGGRPPSARVRDHDFPGTRLDPLVEIISDAEPRDVTFRLPGGRRFTTRTDDAGATTLPLNELARGDLSTGVDPRRGGLVTAQVETPNGTGDESNVLVLPQDYDGPIFICDIDDTLRDTKVVDLATGKTQRPIDGARELLQSVAGKGIPIVYLSAGPDRIRPGNEAFLDQLPRGVFLDRDGLGLKDLDPRGDAQARQQALYKSAAIAQLKNTFRSAQLFGLGDDKYGDAMAYTRQGVRAYIHDVIPGNDHLPADFDGVLTRDYSAGFRRQVGQELDAAIARSASYGGTPAPDNWMGRMSSLLDGLTGTRATAGNAVTPLIDGDEAFPEILKAIDGAQRSLYYEVFQFHGDHKVTKEITDRLIAAHQRGVKVRVALDAYGSELTPWGGNESVERLRAAGIEVASYNPIDSLQDLDIHRDHRKVVIADNQTAFVGGMNTGDQYFGPDTPWRLHDAFVRIQGPAVADVVSHFYDSWGESGGSAVPAAEQRIPPPPPPPAGGGTKTRIIAHEPHQDRNIRAAYLAMFDSARERINVENTFPMSDDLVDSLSAAAQRGVEVRYIVAPGGDVVSTIARKNYQRLLDAGVHIYVYPGPIHTKSISVDGKIASIGSSNVDNMALHRDREIVALVEDPAWVQKLDARLFDRDVVGDGKGRKTVELPRTLDEPFWTRLKNWVVHTVVPDSYE